MKDDRSILKLEALRDFFVAENDTDLRLACQKLSDAGQTSAPQIDDWKQVEFAFNRLFVGPMTLQAPPFASIYLESEPQLMGQTTLKVRTIYELLGLTLPWKNAIPDDHISFELDAYRQLQIALATVNSEELRALQNLLLDHLKSWLFQFINRINMATGVPEAIIFAGNQLENWLNEEITTDESLS